MSGGERHSDAGRIVERTVERSHGYDLVTAVWEEPPGAADEDCRAQHARRVIGSLHLPPLAVAPGVGHPEGEPEP
jgi:hypothetical protein